MTLDQRKLIINAFVTSHFSYCPLVWMFHSRKLNNRINHIHERALRIIYQDYQSSFEELLSKNGSVTIHQTNLRILVTELYKAKTKTGPEMMNELFMFTEPVYNLRKDKLKSNKIFSVRYGIETLSNVGLKLWNSLPNEYRNAGTLIEFRSKMRNWIPNHCPYRICKTFIPELGFL